jgi:hypothetical protein
LNLRGPGILTGLGTFKELPGLQARVELTVWKWQLAFFITVVTVHLSVLTGALCNVDVIGRFVDGPDTVGISFLAR